MHAPDCATELATAHAPDALAAARTAVAMDVLTRHAAALVLPFAATAAAALAEEPAQMDAMLPAVDVADATTAATAAAMPDAPDAADAAPDAPADARAGVESLAPLLALQHATAPASMELLADKRIVLQGIERNWQHE